MNLAVVTISNGRPDALELACGFVAKQIYPLTHIVEEGRPWRENLLAALDRVGGYEAVAFMEDDDYYSPEWVGWCVGLLESGADIAGQRPQRAYHFPSGAHGEIEGSPTQCPLGATVARAPQVEALRLALSKGEVDGRNWCKFLWRLVEGRKVAAAGYRRVTIKGIGPNGYGSDGMTKHTNAAHRDYTSASDPGRETLRGWLCDEEAFVRYQALAARLGVTWV